MSASQSRQCEQGGTWHNRQGGEDESHLKEQLQRIRHKLLVMSGKGVNLIFAGGMGQSALSLFAELGIKVITSTPGREPEALVQGCLSGILVSGPNVCDH